MKYIKRFENLIEHNADYYIEVSLEDAISYCNGNPVPSKYPLPLNYQVIEYVAGVSLEGTTEFDYKDFAMEKCPWYDGTAKSIKNGVNAVNDFDYASEFDEYVLGIKTKSEISEFGDLHLFIKDCNKIKVIFVYDCENNVFIKPENLKLHIDKKIYNL